MSQQFDGAFSINGTSERKEFEVKSGILRVTDPCYDMDTWCAGQVPAANGKWVGHVGYGTDPDDLASALKWHEKRQEDARTDAEATADRMGWVGEQREIYIAGVVEFASNARDKPTEESCRRVQYIHVIHESLAAELDAPIAFSDYVLEKDLHVGVDSGQAGFFCRDPYADAVSDKDNRGKDGPKFDAFYERICDQTLSPTQFAGIEFGVASSSGWGDGGYPCFAKHDADGKVIAAFIAFIWGGDEEEDDGDE